MMTLSHAYRFSQFTHSVRAIVTRLHLHRRGCRAGQHARYHRDRLTSLLTAMSPTAAVDQSAEDSCCLGIL
jgi:hypothetical protein